MDNPPEWAIKQVENALDNQANNESIVQSFARTLAATAARVERETREADAQNAESVANNYSNTRNVDEAMQNAAKDDHAIFIAKSIRSLPRQYKETDNG